MINIEISRMMFLVESNFNQDHIDFAPNIYWSCALNVMIALKISKFAKLNSRTLIIKNKIQNIYMYFKRNYS